MDIYLHDEPETTVSIGDDCMFSFGVIIWPSDGHAIITSDGKCLNKGEDITIGNHVWIGMHSKILKGVNIPSNSIIGASSLVLKNSCKECYSIEAKGYVIAGVPAKLVKYGEFTWKRENPTQYIHLCI